MTFLQTAIFNASTQVSLRWTDFKNISNTKGLLTQYITNTDGYSNSADGYTIFSIDNSILYSCNLLLPSFSATYVFQPDYSQTQNDADTIDFVTNYLPSSNKRIARTDNFGNPISTPTTFAAAFGLLPGIISSRFTGYTANATTSGKAIRATAYTPQGTNAQRSINSTSASDASAGTGARTVTINYLNTSFQLKQDTVTLNGTTAVNTNATDIAFIENMQVATVGTQGGGNVGTIQLFTATAGGGSVWASIAVSDNVTFYAHHYVPAGVTCYLLNISGGATLAAGRIMVNHSSNPLSANLPQLGLGGTYPHMSGGNEDHTFVIPIAIPGPDLIWLVQTPNTATANNTVFGSGEFLQF